MNESVRLVGARPSLVVLVLFLVAAGGQQLRDGSPGDVEPGGTDGAYNEGIADVRFLPAATPTAERSKRPMSLW